MALKQIEEQLNNPVSTDFISLIENCFEKITLTSGEQVRSKVKGEELLKSMANLVNRAKLFGWTPERVGSHVYDHIHQDDQPWNYIALIKYASDYCFRWNIDPLNQTTKWAGNPNDMRILLESKYGPEYHSKIEQYESLKKRRKELLNEVPIPWFFSSPDDAFYQFLLGVIDEKNPDKAREIRDLTTKMQNIKNEIPEAFNNNLRFYKPEIELYVLDKKGRFMSLTILPEDERRDLLEVAKTIRYALSSGWTDEFDETFCQELQSKLYRVCGEVKELRETVKTLLDQPMHIISCSVSNQKEKYVEQNHFDAATFMTIFEKAIEETCKRYPIGNICPTCPELEKSLEEKGLAEIPLMVLEDPSRQKSYTTKRTFRGKKGEIHVLYGGDSIDFILPCGGFYDTLNKAMAAYDGTVGWMFYGSSMNLSANVRDLCVRSPGFSNVVQEKILGKIKENLKR